MNTKITLKTSHIYLDSEIVKTFFEDVNFAFIVYNEEQKSILISPVTSVWFKKMYKPAQFILKSRNLKGDKTLAIREILIDNDLDDSDRELKADYILKTKLIKVAI